MERTHTLVFRQRHDTDKEKKSDRGFSWEDGGPSNRITELHTACYHIYSSRATIFYFSDTVHFSARSLTYKMLRWEVLMDHFCINGLLYSPMLELSLRTVRFEDQWSHLCYFGVVMDAQCYISSFSLDRWCLRWILLHGYDSAFYIVLWLLLLLYWFWWS